VGRIVVTEFISLDDVIEAPGGGEDFQRGGWTLQFDQGADGAKFKIDETLDADAVLLGRVTYGQFAAVWPSQEGEFADKFNTMPKYVVSSTSRTPSGTTRRCWTATWWRRSPSCGQSRDGDIVVHGSAQLVQTLVEHDLLDELHLMVFPVVVGAGKRLFGDTSGTKRLRLADSRTVGDGIAILIYRPAGQDTKASDSN
jgi:dihydrofolate reductase